MASSKYPQHPWLQTALELISENAQEEEQDEAENDSSFEEVSEDADPESVVIEQQDRLQVQDRIRTREEISGLIDVPDESDSNFVWNKFWHYLTYLKEFFKSLIKSFGSSKPICNLTRCSSLLNLKYLLPWLYSSLLALNSCKIAKLSNPPQL